MHRRFIFSLLASLSALAGCANPKAEYDDFVERTNTIRGGDSAVADTTPPDVTASDLDITGTWLGACLPNNIASNPEVALLFMVEAKFTAEASGGGKVDITMTPMKDTATKMDKSETSGASFGKTGIPVATNGQFTLDVGDITIPGDAQRIGASTLKLTGIVFKNQISAKDKYCAEIDGKLVSPFEIDLGPPGDYCVFKPVALGGALPTFKLSDGTTPVGFEGTEYHCP